jgi:regulator of replication initiation timing
MSEEKKEGEIDPLSSLSIEVSQLKNEIAESKKALSDSNKSMVEMMNTNKRLFAELNQVRTTTQPIAPTINVVDMAYEHLKKNLNIDQKKV